MWRDSEALPASTHAALALPVTNVVELDGSPLSVWTIPSQERMIHSRRIDLLLELGLLILWGQIVKPTTRAFEALAQGPRHVRVVIGRAVDAHQAATIVDQPISIDHPLNLLALYRPALQPRPLYPNEG